MALVKVKTTRITEIFISEEPIGAITSVCISPRSGGRGIKGGSSLTQEFVAGVSIPGGLSGAAIRVVTHGIVSGVICGAVVSAGDRVTSYTSGKVTPINTITPVGGISGYFLGTAKPISGSVAAPTLNLISGVGLAANIVATNAQALAAASGAGAMSGITGIQAPAFTGESYTPDGGFHSGAFAGIAFATARVLGKALDHGGVGSGIRLLVDIGG